MFVTVLYVAIIDIKEKETRAWKKKKMNKEFYASRPGWALFAGN